MFLPSLICLGFGSRDIFFKCSRLRMQGQGINLKFREDDVFEAFGKTIYAECLSMDCKAHKMQLGDWGFFV